jgi:hypothetical protein
VYDTYGRTVSPFELEDAADLAAGQTGEAASYDPARYEPAPYWDPARMIEQNRDRDARAPRKARHAGPRGRGHHNVAPRHAAPRHS